MIYIPPNNYPSWENSGPRYGEGYDDPFTDETFRVLKEKETAKFGEYRTRRLVLEAWERLN